MLILSSCLIVSLHKKLQKTSKIPTYSSNRTYLRDSQSLIRFLRKTYFSKQYLHWNYKFKYQNYFYCFIMTDVVFKNTESKPESSQPPKKYKPAVSQANNVFLRKNTKKNLKKIVYYIPTYPRIMIKRLKLINIEENYGQIAATLYLSFNLKGIPRQYQKICMDHIDIILNHYSQLSFSLDDNRDYESYFDQPQQTANYITTCKFQMQMLSQIFYSPFQRVYLSLNFTFLPYYHVQRDLKNDQIDRIVGFRFNVLKHVLGEKFMIGYLNKSFIYGEYVLAKNTDFMCIDIGSEEDFEESSDEEDSESQEEEVEETARLKQEQEDIQEKKKEKKTFIEGPKPTFEQENIITFQIMTYRHPLVALSTIFFPLWILAFTVLMIYFQNSSFSYRIINTATILIAFTAYFHVIRSALPKNITISLAQIVIYTIIGTCLLGLVRAFLIRNQDINIWKDRPFQDPFFVISLCINCLSILMVTGAYVYHRVVLQKRYSQQQYQKYRLSKIYPHEWCSPTIQEKIQQALPGIQILTH